MDDEKIIDFNERQAARYEMPKDDYSFAIDEDRRKLDADDIECLDRAISRLRKRGLTQERAAKLGVRVWGRFDHRVNGKFVEDMLSGAIEYGYRDVVTGEPLPEVSRFRIFNPPKHNRKQKYWQSFDGTRVYVPEHLERGGKRIPMHEVLADLKKYGPLCIVENEEGANTLTQRGVVAMATGGLDNWTLKDSGGELNADLLRINWQGVVIWLCTDADVRNRRKLQDKVMDFADALEEQGASVHVFPMTDLGTGKDGHDDFFDLDSKRGITDWRKLAATECAPRYAPKFSDWGTDGAKLDLSMPPLDLEWLRDEPPPVEWTWDDYLPRGTAGLLVAEGGAGKTFTALRLAVCVATGRPLLNRPTKKGRVVLLTYEEKPDELRRRLYRIFRQECDGLTKEQVKALERDLETNLVLKSVVTQPLHVVRMDRGNIVQGRALHTLINVLRAVGGVELVIVDPLSRAHSLPDETQAWGTAIMSACERIAIEASCTVLVTHHTGKNNKRTDLYAARGASALSDAARVVLLLIVADQDTCEGVANVSPDEIASGNILRLITAKVSYGKRAPEQWLCRGEGGVLVPFSPELDLTKRLRVSVLYEWWKQRGRQPFTKTHVKTKCTEIFGKDATSRSATKVVEGALEFGTLIEVPAKTKSNKRQTRLTFSTAFIAEQEDDDA